jgi:serpin B
MLKPLFLVAFSFLSFILLGQNTSGLVYGNTEFALKLYQQLAKNKPEENFFFSPHSISEAFALTYAGARKNTESQIKKVFCFSEKQKELHVDFGKLSASLSQNLDDVKLISANSLWAQKGYKFLPEYLQLTQNRYQAPTNYVNFKKQKTRNKSIVSINKWVENKTNQKISELLSKTDLTEDTRLVLVNAIYFFGEWHKAFNPEKTETGIFNTQGQTQKVPFMHQQGKYLLYTDDLISALSIPYKDNKQSMVIFLPEDEKGICKLEQNFDNYYLENIFKDMQEVEVDLKIPKFTIEYATELKQALFQMGVSDAFDNKADFSGMTKKNDLKIDKILHKAKIEVSEEGTEAAAATAIVMVRKSASLKTTRFYADHPFIYMIRDNSTGVILFLGKLASVQ